MVSHRTGPSSRTVNMGGDYRRPIAAYDPFMGFNPFREHRTNALDIALVVGAMVVAVGLVAWAMMG